MTPLRSPCGNFHRSPGGAWGAGTPTLNLPTQILVNSGNRFNKTLPLNYRTTTKYVILTDDSSGLFVEDGMITAKNQFSYGINLAPDTVGAGYGYSGVVSGFCIIGNAKMKMIGPGLNGVVAVHAFVPPFTIGPVVSTTPVALGAGQSLEFLLSSCPPGSMVVFWIGLGAAVVPSGVTLQSARIFDLSATYGPLF
jgi:hypothetical protein